MADDGHELVVVLCESLLEAILLGHEDVGADAVGRVALGGEDLGAGATPYLSQVNEAFLSGLGVGTLVAAGVAFGGIVDVANRLYRKVLATDNVSLELMTLPDAVDYARFLIRTTADYQRFAKMVPVVDGDEPSYEDPLDLMDEEQEG